MQHSTAKSFLYDQLDELSSSVISAIIYFDIFQYPLRLEEIISFLPQKKVNAGEVMITLNRLTAEGYIFNQLNLNHTFLFINKEDFFYLNEHPGIIERRLKGNLEAMKMMRTAKRFSKLIQSFPFVRCVCISGSLSKGFIDEKGDIDYFIITEPNRLWISRMLLIVFKKIFLLNSRKYFCVNYFIDTGHLEIPDKNIFTATELLSLLPMTNQSLFSTFVQHNEWTFDYLPNYHLQQSQKQKEHTSFLKKITEKIFSGPLGEMTDKWFMHLTIQRWKRKFPHFSAADFEHSLRSRRYISKHHPQNFQKHVLNKLDEKHRQFEESFNVKLQHG